MDRNYTIRMDPDTYDIAFDENGMMETLTGDETTAQCVRLTLLAWKAEFPLDEAHGTDYGRVLGQPSSTLDEQAADEVLREAILQEGEVATIDRLEATLSGRALGVSFAGTLAGGQAITLEVRR